MDTTASPWRHDAAFKIAVLSAIARSTGRQY
jgi:hypothetical protein